MAEKLEVAFDPDAGIIIQIMEGYLTEQDALYLENETRRLIPLLPDINKVKVMVDASKAGSASAGARKIFNERLKSQDFYKLAVWGLKPFIRSVVTFFAIASGTKKIRFFKTREDAFRWLNESEGE